MLLKRLTEAFGPPGQEDEVRKLLKQEITPHVDRLWTDTLGNLLAEKKGKEEGTPRVLLVAHMDEVGLMVTHIEKDGFLRFKTMGGIDQRVLIAKTVVVGRDRVPGVIGSKAIHLLEPEERKKAFRLRDLYIDIGARSKEEAEKLVTLGDGAIFQTSFHAFGQGRYKGKALDDRVGCAVLVELLRDEYPSTIYAAFTTQEEVGLRGGRVAAYGLKPDLALVLDATIAADVPDSRPHQTVARLGYGPVLTLMDRTLIADPFLLGKLQETARAEGIPYQLRRTATGGTDGGAIHLTGSGIPTAVVAVPCRYLHSPVSVMDEHDYRNMISLVGTYLKQLPQRGIRQK